MHYYGTRLSDNISLREPEGYLLCLNVPVARTGTQEYLPGELGLPPGSSLIPVLRPEEEVFSPETIASFEGMPVTNDHPPEGVDIGNIRALQKGHAHNVRRGTGGESDLLLADLIITDPELIRLILEEGKREISCGYTYELAEENGRYIQRGIRGNHVAVVDSGRAGPRVSIRDRRPGTAAGLFSQPNRKERRTRNMKKSLSKVLARMAKDGDTETVAEIIEEMIEPAGESEAPAAAGGTLAETVRGGAAAVESSETTAVVETPEETTVAVDEATLGEVLSRLDQIISLLTPAAADDDPVEEITEAIGEALEASLTENADPVTGEIAAVMEEVLEPAFSTVLEENGDEEAERPETLPADDALRAALTAVRPVLARMPKRLRGRMAGDIAARLRSVAPRKSADGSIYAALGASRRKPARSTAELGRRIMEKRNSNYRRG